MIFNESLYYLAFLAPTVAVFHRVRQELRPWVLALSGIAFFVYFGGAHFGGLVGSLAVLILLWELLSSRLYRPASRWCVLGILQAVAVLVVFKYLGFLTGAWNDAFSWSSALTLPPAPKLVLPLGLSFFTFEFIHFAADMRAGRIEKAPLREYAAFIFYFPTMVAGPIKRFGEFVPKLRVARFDGELFSRGITRILVGLVKKHAFADTLTLVSARLSTDQLFQASGPEVLAWVFAYGFKIYFDFSGYSDIAIGSSYLFGIEVPENFSWPYLSRNIAEFWRRWHISLGRWIFDYVYAPLGGSRHGPARNALNLMAAFAVSGIWHGAAYNFLAWGLWHGLLSVGYRGWGSLAPRLGIQLPRAVAVGITFFAVNLGWAFFCMDLKRAGFAVGRIFGWA